MANLAEPRITVRAIAVMVAKEFGITVNVLIAQNRTGEVAFARHVAMYLALEQSGKSTLQVGAFFSRDHSTVISGHRKIAEAIEADADLARRVGALVDRIVAFEVRMQTLPQDAAADPDPVTHPDPPPPVEPAISIPATGSALSRAVDTYLKARKRLEDDRFSRHEHPSRRNEEIALGGLRIAYHDFLAGGRAS